MVVQGRGDTTGERDPVYDGSDGGLSKGNVAACVTVAARAQSQKSMAGAALHPCM